FIFGYCTGAGTAANLFEDLRHQSVNDVADNKMALNLLLGPGSFKASHQVTGADNLLAKAPHQLYGACVHQPDVRDEVVWGILHSHSAVSREHGLQVVPELLPGGVLALAAGQGIQVAGFNAMHQLCRLALLGDQVKPATSDHLVLAKTQYL